MMRYILLAAFLITLVSFRLHASELEQLRKAFYKASMEQQVCESIYNKIKDKDYDTKPLMLGYKGVYQAIMAKYVWNPFSKWWFFKSGVEQLENAIEMDGDNIELIFLRFSVQTNCPSFLGYYENIEKDKAFILKNIEDFSVRSKYNSFIKDIINYMLGSTYLTVPEKELLRNIDKGTFGSTM